MSVLRSLPALRQPGLAATDQLHIAGLGLSWSHAAQSVRSSLQQDTVMAYHELAELVVLERILAEADIAAQVGRWWY